MLLQLAAMDEKKRPHQKTGGLAIAYFGKSAKCAPATGSTAPYWNGNSAHRAAHQRNRPTNPPRPTTTDTPPSLPKISHLHRWRDRLYWDAGLPPPPDPLEIRLPPDEPAPTWTSLNGRLTFTKTTGDGLSLAKTGGSLQLRPRQGGERLTPAGRPTRRVADLLQESAVYHGGVGTSRSSTPKASSPPSLASPSPSDTLPANTNPAYNATLSGKPTDRECPPPPSSSSPTAPPSAPTTGRNRNGSFAPHAGEPYAIWLDSADPHHPDSRYSFIATAPRTHYQTPRTRHRPPSNHRPRKRPDRRARHPGATYRRNGTPVLPPFRGGPPRRLLPTTSATSSKRSPPPSPPTPKTTNTSPCSALASTTPVIAFDRQRKKPSGSSATACPAKPAAARRRHSEATSPAGKRRLATAAPPAETTATKAE